MGQAQKNRDSYLYAVRRSAAAKPWARSGPWEERLSLNGKGKDLWRPVGTFAAEVLRYIRWPTKDPRWEILEPLADRFRQFIREAWTSAFTLEAQEALMSGAREAIWRWPVLPWRLREPFKIVLEWELPGRWVEATLSLSTGLGIQTRRLRPCENCQEPYAIPIKPSKRRSLCGECRATPDEHEDLRIYLNGLPVRDPRRRLWFLMNQRLRAWVSRRILTRKQRNAIRARLAEDIQRLQERELVASWESLLLKPGRGARKGNRERILTQLVRTPVGIGPAHGFRVHPWWVDDVRL